MVPINGNAYAIRSESILPSLFSGKISATSFKGDGLELTNVNAIKLNQLSSKSISFGESCIQNYRNRLLDDGYTYFPNSLGNTYALLKELNIQNKASIVIGASGVKTSLLPAVKGLPLDVTRASTATYIDENGILQTALANVPRVTYDENGDESILVEPQSTNLFLYSEQFDNVYWVKTGVTISSDFAPSIINGSLADKFTENSSLATQHRIQRIATTTIGQVTTLSCFVKRNSGTRQFSLNSPQSGFRIYFNLDTGTIATTVSGSGTITDFGNGWFKLTATGTAIADNPTYYFQMTNSTAMGSETYDGDGSSSFLIIGAQIETLPYATSYMPTVASAVTRVADIVSKIGISNLLNSSEGVFYMEAKSDKIASYIEINNSIVTNRLALGHSGNQVVIRYVNGTDNITLIETS
jgi:hypothetical protein